MTIRAVLFDLDNTLTHRDHSIDVYSQHFVTAYQQYLNHVDVQHIQSIIRSIDQGGYPQKEHLSHPSIAASVGYALQQQLNWNHVPELEELTQFWFQQFGLAAVAMSGAEQLLIELKQQGYQLAVVSNGGHATRLKILQGLGFQHYFDCIISSETAGISKPHPEIFHYSSQQLNLPVENCLFVGDHPVNDIQGATNAGMQALWLEGFHIPTQQPLYRIQNLAQIRQFLSF